MGEDRWGIFLRILGVKEGDRWDDRGASRVQRNVFCLFMFFLCDGRNREKDLGSESRDLQEQHALVGRELKSGTHVSGMTVSRSTHNSSLQQERKPSIQPQSHVGRWMNRRKLAEVVQKLQFAQQDR